jgi:hypothetical protein
MVPRRKLSEVLTFAKITKVCQLLVEGPADQAIIRSFCDGAAIPTAVSPITIIEVDCCDVRGLGGNKGRLIRFSEHLAKLGGTRTFCIVDRDDFPFDGFNLNSHCLITDFSCLEMYALLVEDLRTYLNRAFFLDMTAEELESILSTARLASVMLWEKEKALSGCSLANIDNSLAVNDRRLIVDISHWIDRSRGEGSKEAWDALLARVRAREATLPRDYRFTTSVHALDDAIRFWMRKTKGLTLFPRWVEQHLRGLASHATLSTFDFFVALSQRCWADLQKVV